MWKWKWGSVAVWQCVIPLIFLRSNQPCFIVMLILLADEVFLQILRIYQQHFRSGSLASFVFYD